MAYAATALAVLCIASALVPGLAYYANKTAQWHYDEGRVEAAASTQRLAVALRPNDALMLTNLGVYYQDLYYRTGDLQMLDMAAAWTLRARDANPAYLPARQEYASTILGRLSGDPARDARIHPRLIRVYESILELDPFLPFVMQNLAEAYYRSGQVEKAEARLKAALEIEPNFVGGYLKLADWMESAGRTMESESLKEQVAVVVARYADRQRLTEYEAMLLGRPVSVAGVVR